MKALSKDGNEYEGYISFDMLNTFSNTAALYDKEILDAETFIIDQSGKDEKDRVSEELIRNILLCTIKSREHSEIQPITFDMARKLCESSHTTIRNGFVFVKDVEFLTQLLNADEPMGSLRNDKVETFNRESILNDTHDNKCIESALNGKKDVMPDLPFVINLSNTYCL